MPHSEENPIVEVEKAIKTYALMEAKCKAETAELHRRLAMLTFRPCNLYPISLYYDGMRWVCEYLSMHRDHEFNGEKVVAYGANPEDALKAYDRLWIGEEEETEAEDDVI